jgi:hypothetical protein
VTNGPLPQSAYPIVISDDSEDEEFMELPDLEPQEPPQSPVVFRHQPFVFEHRGPAVLISDLPPLPRGPIVISSDSEEESTQSPVLYTIPAGVPIGAENWNMMPPAYVEVTGTSAIPGLPTYSEATSYELPQWAPPNSPPPAYESVATHNAYNAVAAAPQHSRNIMDWAHAPN